MRWEEGKEKGGGKGRRKIEEEKRGWTCKKKMEKLFGKNLGKVRGETVKGKWRKRWREDTGMEKAEE